MQTFYLFILFFLIDFIGCFLYIYSVLFTVFVTSTLMNNNGRFYAQTLEFYILI